MADIGFLHTADVHVATFERLVADAAPSAVCRHAVDAPLLDRARRGDAPHLLHADVRALLSELVAGGADVVVCTCSTLGPIAEQVGASLPVPVLRVDRPMAQAAVAAGPRIAVVAALASTLEPTRALLAEEAARAGATPQVVEVCVAQAWEAFEAGDLGSYAEQVAVAARSAAGGADVVVLAQASMLGASPLLADLAVPVLASPGLAVQRALALAE